MKLDNMKLRAVENGAIAAMMTMHGDHIMVTVVYNMDFIL